MKKMRNCPYCGEDVGTDILGVHYNEQLGKWLFNHFCDHKGGDIAVSVTVYGNTEQEVIDKWNGVQHEQEHPTE
jgi:hypothetical protein